MDRAIFFDLDGTLWDAISSLCISWNKAMEEHNLPYRFDEIKMMSYMGLTPIETAPLAFTDVSIDKGLEYFKICLDSEIKYLRTNPGKMYNEEREILSMISNKYPLFIVSNSDKGYIEDYLDSLNMNEYFVDHVCAGDTGLEKWENILFLKSKYEIKEVIYVGDTLKDYKEATKAKVKFIHASYGFGKIDEKVFKISNLKELLDIVDTVFDTFN